MNEFLCTTHSYPTELPPYPDFHAHQEARAKLPRGSYEGNKHLPLHQGGPWPGTKPTSASTGAWPRTKPTSASTPVAKQIAIPHQGDHGAGQGPVRPQQQKGSGLGSQALFSGVFRPQIWPPTGSLVAAINSLSQRK